MKCQKSFAKCNIKFAIENYCSFCNEMRHHKIIFWIFLGVYNFLVLYFVRQFILYFFVFLTLVSKILVFSQMHFSSQFSLKVESMSFILLYFIFCFCFCVCTRQNAPFLRYNQFYTNFCDFFVFSRILKMVSIPVHPEKSVSQKLYYLGNI